jgi:hypothetical protein
MTLNVQQVQRVAVIRVHAEVTSHKRTLAALERCAACGTARMVGSDDYKR